MAPKDSWIRAYLRGNLLMPQAYECGAIFLAKVVVEERQLDAFAEAAFLEPHQLAHIRQSMQRAHQVRRIPAGNVEYLDHARAGNFAMNRAILVDDEKLTYIWNRFRNAGISVARYFDRPGQPNALPRLSEAFRTPECRALLRQFRAQYDRRNVNATDMRAFYLKLQVLTHVEQYARVVYPLPAGFLKNLLAEAVDRPSYS
jgi:hypothetical protein